MSELMEKSDMTWYWIPVDRQLFEFINSQGAPASHFRSLPNGDIEIRVEAEVYDTILDNMESGEDTENGGISASLRRMYVAKGFTIPEPPVQ
jgi:hypothetical protein